MNEAERQQLAQRLSAMSLKEVRNEIRRIDPKAVIKFYRNSIWDEYHTLWLLPNAELSITLVEKEDREATNKRDFSGPADRHRIAAHFSYIEARVEPLTRPVAKF